MSAYDHMGSHDPQPLSRHVENEVTALESKQMVWKAGLTKEGVLEQYSKSVGPMDPL